MKAIEPRPASARQLESEGFRFHPASAETGTRGRVAMNTEGPCLSCSVIPAKAGIHFGPAWERLCLARMRGPEVRRRSSPPHARRARRPRSQGAHAEDFAPRRTGHRHEETLRRFGANLGVIP